MWGIIMGEWGIIMGVQVLETGLELGSGLATVQETRIKNERRACVLCAHQRGSVNGNENRGKWEETVLHPECVCMVVRMNSVGPERRQRTC